MVGEDCVNLCIIWEGGGHDVMLEKPYPLDIRKKFARLRTAAMVIMVDSCIRSDGNSNNIDCFISQMCWPLFNCQPVHLIAAHEFHGIVSSLAC
jgi:hypothetical protein